MNSRVLQRANSTYILIALGWPLRSAWTIATRKPLMQAQEETTVTILHTPTTQILPRNLAKFQSLPNFGEPILRCVN